MRYLTLALNVNCYYCTKNEEILNGKLHFCAVYRTAKSLKARHNNLSAIEKWREKTGVVFHCIRSGHKDSKHALPFHWP